MPTKGVRREAEVLGHIRGFFGQLEYLTPVKDFDRKKVHCCSVDVDRRMEKR